MSKATLYRKLTEKGLDVATDKRYTASMLTDILEFIDARDASMEAAGNLELLQHNNDLIKERDILLKKCAVRCSCGKQDCILRSDSAFATWYIRYAANSECPSKTIKINRETYVAELEQCDTHIDHKKHKCQMVKQMVEMKFYIFEIEKTNNRIFQVHDKLETAFDKEVVINLKLKEHMKKNLTDIMSLEKQVKQMEELDRQKNAELRHLKRTNKKLTRVVVNQVPKVDSEEEDERESTYQNPLETISTYQKIKNYCCSHDISVSGICRRNPLVNKKTIFNKFLSLQYARLQFAHPKVESISSDDEFISILSSP